MDTAIEFWLDSYEKKWFVRWSTIDKPANKAIGSVELFHRILMMTLMMQVFFA